MHHEMCRWVGSRKFIQEVFLCPVGKVNRDRNVKKLWSMCSLPTFLSFEFVKKKKKKKENILGAVLGSVTLHLGTWLMTYRPVLTSDITQSAQTSMQGALTQAPPPGTTLGTFEYAIIFSLPSFLTMSVLSLVFLSIISSKLVDFSLTWNNESEPFAAEPESTV